MPITIPPAYGFQPVNDIVAASQVQATALGGGMTKDLDRVLSQTSISSQAQSMALGQLTLAIGNLSASVNRLNSLLPGSGLANIPTHFAPSSIASFQPPMPSYAFGNMGTGVGSVAGAFSRLPSGQDINSRIFQGMGIGFAAGPAIMGGLGSPGFGYTQMLRSAVGGMPGGFEAPFGGVLMRDRSFLSLLFQAGVGPGLPGMAQYGGPVIQEAAKEELGRKLKRGLFGAAGAGTELGAGMLGASLAGGGLIGGTLGFMAGGGVAGAALAPLAGTAMEMAGLGETGETLRMGAPRIMQGRRGQRFSGRELADMSTFLVKRAAEDPVLRQTDMQQILAGSIENDLFLGVRNVKDFKNRMEQLINANKEIARTFHTNFREASRVIGEFRNMGFDPTQAAGLTGRVGALADVAGMRRMDVLQFGQQGAEIARAQGAPMQAGFRVGMESIAAARTAAGYLPAATLGEIGGTRGLGQTLTQATMQHVMSPYGQSQLAAGMISGRPGALGGMGFGAGGIFETMGAAAQNLGSREGIMQFYASRARMTRRRARDPLAMTEDVGNTAIRLIQQQGMEVNEDTMVGFLSSGAVTGTQMSEDQARAIWTTHRRMPEIKKERDASEFLEAQRTALARRYEETSTLSRVGRWAGTGLAGAGEAVVDIFGIGGGIRGGVAAESPGEYRRGITTADIQTVLGKRKETALARSIRTHGEEVGREDPQKRKAAEGRLVAILQEAVKRSKDPKEQADYLRSQLGGGVRGMNIGLLSIIDDLSKGTQIDLGDIRTAREEVTGQASIAGLQELVAQRAEQGGTTAGNVTAHAARRGMPALFRSLLGTATAPVDAGEQESRLQTIAGALSPEAVENIRRVQRSEQPQGLSLEGAMPKDRREQLAAIFAEEGKQKATAARTRGGGLAGDATQEEREEALRGDTAEVLQNLVKTSQALLTRAERL